MGEFLLLFWCLLVHYSHRRAVVMTTWRCLGLVHLTKCSVKPNQTKWKCDTVAILPHNQSPGLSCENDLELRRRGDFLCFICHTQDNTLGLLTENSQAEVALTQVSASYHTWQPSEYQVIWLCRRLLCTRRQPRSWGVSFMWAYTHKRWRDLCVFIFCCSSETTVVNNSLWLHGCERH